jgi:hypothetical protein
MVKHMNNHGGMIVISKQVAEEQKSSAGMEECNLGSSNLGQVMAMPGTNSRGQYQKNFHTLTS